MPLNISYFQDESHLHESVEASNTHNGSKNINNNKSNTDSGPGEGMPLNVSDLQDEIHLHESAEASNTDNGSENFNNIKSNTGSGPGEGIPLMLISFSILHNCHVFH